MQVNGVELNVHIEGKGPPVLLVHGFPDCHDVWRKQIPALVAAGYRVIAPDQRGCGESEAPTGSRNYRAEVVVADLVALLDVLAMNKVRLVAHDMGAAICWQFCMLYTERVDRYVAMSVGHPTAYARAPLEQKLKGWYVLFMLLRGLAEWVLGLADWRPFRALVRYEDEVPRWIARLARPGRLTAAVNYYRGNTRDYVLPKRWMQLTAPERVNALLLDYFR